MAGRSTILAVALMGALTSSGWAQEYRGTGVEARIWLDRGESPVVERGERVRVYYRTSRDAFVSIFQIDTDGTARLVFPRSPEENHYVRGGRDYRLLFPRSPYWNVEDYPGVGYYFILASPEPFDFRQFRYSAYEGGWDLQLVGRTVYGDPYVAMDDFVAALLPDWQYIDYALDFVEYNVGSAFHYPRFLCYDCHGFRPYYAWNPYRYSCVSFRLWIYDSPYYYPGTRYRGTRVVYTRPPRDVGPRFEFKERADGEPGTPVVTQAVRDRPGVRGSPAPRRVTGAETGSVTDRPASPGTGVDRGGRNPAVGRPGTSGGDVPRRPSAVIPRSDKTPVPPVNPREGGDVRPGDEPSRARGDRPVLQRRPTEGETPRQPATRPSGGQTRPSSPPPSSRPSSPPPSSRPSSPPPSSRPSSPPPSSRPSSPPPSSRPSSPPPSSGRPPPDGSVAIVDASRPPPRAVPVTAPPRDRSRVIPVVRGPSSASDGASVSGPADPDPEEVERDAPGARQPVTPGRSAPEERPRGTVGTPSRPPTARASAPGGAARPSGSGSAPSPSWAVQRPAPPPTAQRPTGSTSRPAVSRTPPPSGAGARVPAPPRKGPETARPPARSSPPSTRPAPPPRRRPVPPPRRGSGENDAS